MSCYLAKDEIIKESLSGGDKPRAVGEIPLPHPVSQMVSPQGLNIHPWICWCYVFRFNVQTLP